MSSTKSTDLLPHMTAQTCPLLAVRKEDNEPKDWVKIGAIVAAVVGALIAALAAACYMGTFPQDLLGGQLGMGITFVAGASILIPAAYVLIHKYFLSDDKP